MKEIVAAIGDEHDAVSVRGQFQKTSVLRHMNSLILQRVARCIEGSCARKRSNVVLQLKQKRNLFLGSTG